MKKIVEKCRELLEAYEMGQLGQTIMPEDSNPGFSKNQYELKLSYFTLPMALNYQRNSYKLWDAALKTINDKETRCVFDVGKVSKLKVDHFRDYLMRYKLALQPNKHVETWQRICSTVSENWGSFSKLIDYCNNDFLILKKTVQINYKSAFPYISGPKIFNYWSFILGKYCDVKLINSSYIEIAPDTHITKCSVKLGLLTEKEATNLSKESISLRWRNMLKDTGIDPINMHAPLWFWSRNGFVYKLKS